MNRDAHAHVVQEIATLLDSFPHQMSESKAALAELLALDPEVFCLSAIGALKHPDDGPGWRYLAGLLAKEDLLVPGLLDAAACNLQESIALAKSMVEAGVSLQCSLEQALSAALKERAPAAGVQRLLRILDLVAATSAENRWSLFQSQLMEHPDKTVQSKAALLIGGASKNAEWIARHVQNGDSRVQANAVEALWKLDASDSHAMLRAACQSPNNRVAGNAALGLYRIGDPAGIRILLNMVERDDRLSQLSGLWAIGESHDPRFLPYLMERFAKAQGSQRLAITRALSSIRRRVKTIQQAGAVEIRISEAHLRPDGSRNLAVVLGSPTLEDLSCLKATDFALWEGASLVLDYAVRPRASEAVLAAGFVAPWFASMAEPGAGAVGRALSRCLLLKRTADLWRIDRYAAANGSPVVPAVEDGTPANIGDVLHRAGPGPRNGFSADKDLLRETVRSPGAHGRAVPDLLLALERQCHAMSKLRANRHILVLLGETAEPSLEDVAGLNRLKNRIENERIALHGFAPANSATCREFERFCLESGGGTFTLASSDELPAATEQVYAHMLNQFEINYRMPAGFKPDRVKLTVSSDHGTGQAECDLQPAG